MKRILGTAILLMLVAPMLFASVTQKPGVLANTYSALRSVSYYGTMGDIYYNPAALPFSGAPTSYLIDVAYSERYPSPVDKLPHISNPEAELRGEVKSGPVSLSAKAGAYFDDKVLRSDGKTYFDIYSTIDMEVSLGYSFWENFAIGGKLGGGNAMARFNKPVDGYVDMVQNALFAPFEKADEMERLTSGLGFLAFFDSFTLGIYSDSILSAFLIDGGGLSRTLAETTVSVSYKGEKYTQGGDLTLLLPRASISYKGFSPTVDERAFSLQGDVTVQMMKNLYVDGGLMYIHEVLGEGETDRTLALSVNASWYSWSLTLNLAYGLGDNRFLPSMVFSYSD